MILTRDDFTQFKHDYTFYSTHLAMDAYGNEQRVGDDTPRGVIHTMWHPLSDNLAFAEWGRDIDKIMYCIAYSIPDGLTYGDTVTVYGEVYEVIGIRTYNTHWRVDVKKKVTG